MMASAVCSNIRLNVFLEGDRSIWQRIDFISYVTKAIFTQNILMSGL